jgi:hypothetical protein
MLRKRVKTKKTDINTNSGESPTNEKVKLYNKCTFFIYSAQGLQSRIEFKMLPQLYAFTVQT